MIKEKHFEEFEKIFGSDLKPFVNFYGLDVIKFDEKIGTRYPESTKDRVLELYGQDAVDLIIEMLNTVQDELNGDLSEVEDGTEKTFLITETKNFAIHNTVEVTGLIYYPFAIERISKMKWKLHHLPSGYFVKPEILGKKML